ncbi:hypothetical protein F2Q69_00005713 [Brassica cretica]|uniref:Uncharacterized protein n=1 Tax=Brassica cretica TaxID=69181 RepID=A0A8S9P184_BRACR|nr:hypothetical protein F2Q69_00005713 [Brassica cretica]
MKQRITLKKKSDPGKFVVRCLIGGIDYPSALCDTGASVSILPKVMADHLGFIRKLEVQIGNALVPVDLHVLDIKLNWNSSLLLRRAFMATVGAVCDMPTNKMCLTLIDPTVYPVRFVKQPTGYMEIGDNHGFIAAFQCDHEADEESEISIDDKLVATIDNELETLIDNDHATEIDNFPEGSVNSWENDYYQPSFAVHTSTPSKRKMSAMEHDEYDEDNKEEASIEYRGLAMEEAGVLRDELGFAKAPDGRIIHVSREDIRDIMKRSTMYEEASICLPEHAEKFNRILPSLRSYSRADIDDMVHGICRSQEMSLDDTYRRLDDVYYPLNDSIYRLTTRMDELKEEMDMIWRQNAI